MSALYLVTLLVSAGCVVALDLRFRLFFGRDARRAAAVLVIGVAFFVAWDLLGIGFGVFARGDGLVSTGILLAPEFPLEELVFLAFLVEVTMVLVFGFEQLLRRRTKDPG